MEERDIDFKPQVSFEEKLKFVMDLLEKEKYVFYTPSAIFKPSGKGWKIAKIFKPIREIITAYGHENVLATHETTLEITKEDFLTEKGDCIIGIKADKACKDLSEEFKLALKSGCKIKITIKVDDLEDSFYAFGSPALTLKDERSLVIRKSDYIDDRTLAILSEKAAKDIDRKLIEKLKNPTQKVIIILEVEQELR